MSEYTRHFRPGETVIAWSPERTGESRLTICTVTEVTGDEVYLYAIADNTNFYRSRKDIMTYHELSEDFKRITEDIKFLEKWDKCS